MNSTKANPRPLSFPQSTRVETPKDLARIRGIVAREFNLSVASLIGPGRPDRTAWPRQIGMYLSRKLTPRSYQTIALAFGRRDHATAIHAQRLVQSCVGNEPKTARLVHSLEAAFSQWRAAA